ncbi:MAG: alpha/beta fold hydrolase [Draconibacterium sp.]
MNELQITFENNGEIISGIQHLPDKEETGGDSIVIFLHGFAGYRIGPHQLFVKLARELAQSGYRCIRFDFRGRGYSQGSRDATSYKTMVSDLDIVLSEVHKKYNPKQVILLGICSGTRTALYYIKDKTFRVDALIGLSSPPLVNTVNVNAASNRTKSVIEEYVVKAKNIENWKRLLKGDINTKMIAKIIGKNLKAFGYAVRSKIFGSPPDKNHKLVSKARGAFPNFRGEVLLIHGEKDPETPVALKQISGLLSSHNIPFQEQIIKGANHSFYSIKWEKEIIQIIKNWLFERNSK